jgi:hypothetical protein
MKHIRALLLRLELAHIASAIDHELRHHASHEQRIAYWMSLAAGVRARLRALDQPPAKIRMTWPAGGPSPRPVTGRHDER